MTPTSGLTSYAANADATAYYDARLIADLIGDTGTRPDPATLPTNATLTKLLKSASGRLEASALAGGRYTAAALAALADPANAYNAGEWLHQLVCDLAIGPLLWRRDPTGKKPEVLQRAEDALADLRAGALIFGEQEVIDAAQPESVGQLGEAESLGLPRPSTSQIAGRYFGDRGVRGFGGGNGFPGVTGGGSSGGAGSSPAAPNTVWAGPTAGPGNSPPSFRALVVADFFGGSGASGTTFLRGDGTWATPAAGGGMTIGGAVTGSTAGSVLFAGGGGVLAQDNGTFFWDAANDRLGLGTAAPQATLHLQNDNVSFVDMRLERNGDVGQANLDFIRTRGSKAVPTNVQTGDVLGIFNFLGYSAGFSGAVTAAIVRAVADGAVPAGANRPPARVEIHTASGAGSALTERLRVNRDGLVAVNRVADPIAQLDVVAKDAATVGASIQMAATPTARAWQILNSAGGDVAYVDAVGTLTVGAGGIVTGGSVQITGVFKTAYVADVSNAVAFFQMDTDSTHAVLLTNRVASRAALTVQGAAAQSADLLQLQDSGAAVLHRYNKGGYWVTNRHSAPADADLAAGDCALWFDQTNGSSALKVKAKQADGTVKTASLPLA